MISGFKKQWTARYVRRLAHRDSTVRSTAAVMLGHFGNSDAVYPLIGALRDTSAPVRLKAVRALARLRDGRAIKPLIEVVSSAEAHGGAGWDVGMVAAKALGVLGDSRAIDTLTKALGYHGVFRCVAAKALARLGQGEWRSIINGYDGDFMRLAASGDERAVDPIIYWMESSRIGKMKDLWPPYTTAVAREALLRVAQLQRRERVGALMRETIKALLMRYDNTRALRLASASLNHADPDVRSAAANVLGALGNPDAVDTLIMSLGDEVGAVRCEAARGLTRLGHDMWRQCVKGEFGDLYNLSKRGHDRAFGTLLKSLRSPDAQVRRNSVFYLGAIGDVRAVEPLIKALADADGVLRCSAAGALGKMGDSRAVEPLIKALADADGVLRCSAAGALGKMGDSRAVEPLIKLLADAEGLVRCYAAAALGKIGDVRAVEPLIRDLGDEGMYERGYCARIDSPDYFPLRSYDPSGYLRHCAGALGKIGDRRAVDALFKALGSPDELVRKEAAIALDSIEGCNWAKMIRGENDDFKRLTTCDDDRVVEPLIMALRNENIGIRRTVAEAIIAVATRRPAVLLTRWEMIKQLIEKPYQITRNESEQVHPGSYDMDAICHTYFADEGIGMSFPNAPSEVTTL